MTETEKIEKALDLAMQYGGIDGDHHKMWVIDQMIRVLTGCPSVSKTINAGSPTEFIADVLGESTEYLEFVRQAKDGDNGPETYEWDIGIAP